MSAAKLAARLGLHRAGREWRGACPCCGYVLSFALSIGRNGRPIAWCASCQDQPAVLAALRAAEGGAWQPPAERQPDHDRTEQLRRRALALWTGAVPVRGTPAERYLGSRCIGHVAASPALRFRSDTPHPAGGRLPALLAAVTGPDGGVVALHRTYLKRDGGGKASVEPAKASLGPVHGGAVRLDEAAPELAIGEGVETAAAAGKLLGLPAWAAISCGNLAGAVLPALVRSVVIAVDRDEPGERAARAAAWRWQREGRHVRMMLPDRAGADANDVLRERRYA
ncbi:MAG: DUF7146 domain-containing protein [Acetobacteraceae bacterium]